MEAKRTDLDDGRFGCRRPGSRPLPDWASWFASYAQSQVVGNYATQINHARPDAATQLALAREHNEALTYGAIVAAGENIPVGKEQSSSDRFNCWEILRAGDTGLMARVRIPSIDVDLPVYHGTSDEVLNEGAGHLQGSHFPVGGAGARTVITAHRGLPDADMFDDLGKLVEGNRFTIETFGEVLTYEVVESQVIEPHETDVIRLQEGRDLATLITCTPLGLNTHRIIATGERVLPTPPRGLRRSRRSLRAPPLSVVGRHSGCGISRDCLVLSETRAEGRGLKPTQRVSVYLDAGDACSQARQREPTETKSGEEVAGRAGAGLPLRLDSVKGPPEPERSTRRKSER